MSCNCEKITVTSPDGECLPTVADDCALAKESTVCTKCPTDDTCLKSDESAGTTLPTSWTDAGCYDENVTLLGRVGTKLARFKGSGFIKIVGGVASVVSSVPLRVVTLWHRYWKPTATSAPIAGDPLAYPYAVIGDSEGNLHAIKGPASEDAVQHWDASAKQYTQKPVSEVDYAKKGAFIRADNIELVGFSPIPDGGFPETVREVRGLQGSGLVVLEEADTVDPSCDCAPGKGTVSKATTLALPTPAADEVYTLKYSTALGLHWAEDA